MVLQTSKIWLGVKGVTALFQIPATYTVFYEVFLASGRSPFWAGLGSLLAITLIDVFFIAVLHFLEEPTDDPIQKGPLVAVGILLLGAVIWIGYLDEGMLSWAPRLGFIGLVMTDVFNWVLEMFRWATSRERFEKMERDRMVKVRRKAMNNAFKQAINDPGVKQVIRQIQMRRLGKDLNVPEMYGQELDVLLDSPLVEEDRQRVEALLDQQNWDSPELYLEDYAQWERRAGIIHSLNGVYYFVSPTTGELFYKTVQGKPYTESGAKRALGRHLSKVS